MKLLKKKNPINNIKLLKGFTLVELLVVMAILGVLVTLVGTSFMSAQMRGRDAQRKSDLKQISSALELFFNDYGTYPSDSDGVIMACPYQTGGEESACTWSDSLEFKDYFPGTAELRTIYLKKVPMDPSSSYNYYYRVVPGSNNKKFQIFAHLENTQDKNCIDGNCVNPVSYSCGDALCNFALTSSNTNAIE